LVFLGIVISMFQAAKSYQPPTVASPPKESAPASRWEYESSVDKMTGESRHYATVNSPELLKFDFPYSGGSQPSISVRSQGKSENVLLIVDRGQFICSVGGCSVTVKFDDGKLMKFSAVGPTDYSSNVLFLSPAKKFIELMKKSKETSISATFHREGDRVMTFPTKNLEWTAPAK
jgi:hypothetical protein